MAALIDAQYPEKLSRRVVFGLTFLRDRSRRHSAAVFRHPEWLQANSRKPLRKLNTRVRFPSSALINPLADTRKSSSLSPATTRSKDTELRGIPVKSADRAAMFYPSANRDETHFAHPDRFDVGRSPNQHMAFGGGGTHFCLVANLARVEATAIVPEVLSRMDDLELVRPVERARHS